MRLTVLALALALGGCASIGKAPTAPGKLHVLTHPAPRSTSAPTSLPTPAEQVKRRWYDRFKVHPKWFHS